MFLDGRYSDGIEMLLRVGMALLILSDIWLQRFAIPLSSTQWIPIVLFTSYLGIGAALASGRVIVSRIRLELFTISVVFFTISAFSIIHPFAPISFYYIIIIYLPFLFLCPLQENEYKWCAEVFQWGMIPISLLAIFQYVTENKFDPVLAYFPNYALPGFNTHPPIAYGSTVLRSNGMFMLEPSILSQYCAVGILLELLYWRKWWRAVVFGLALLSSASGTGTLLLAVMALAYAWKYKKIPHIAIVLGAIALFAYMFPDAPVVNSFIDRSTEYQSEGSSAYQRFVGPVYQTVAQLGDSWQHWLFGVGPGNTKDQNLAFLTDADRGILWAPLQLLVSYGIVGSMPFVVFVLHCFFHAARSYILATALLIFYCYLSPSLLQPFAVFLCFALVGFLPPEARQLQTVSLGGASEELTSR